MQTRRPPLIHLGANVQGLAESATLQINAMSARLEAEGKTIFRLGLGQSPFPVPDVIVEALRVNAAEKAYLPVRGLAELRNAVAAYYRHAQGLSLSGEDILIGPGSKELMFLLQLVYGGELVVPVPSWVSYAPQARLAGRSVRSIPMRPPDWLLSAADLERVCREQPERPRVVVLNYPSNPTGGTYDAPQLEELAAVARRYRVVVLSDEIYGELYYGPEHRSIARYYPEGTIVSGGLSKWAGAGGWRLGTFAFPPELRWLLDAMAVAASETFTSTSAPIQHAAVRAFEGGEEIDEYLRQVRRILEALGRRVAARWQRAGINVAAPAGGFYLFPDFSPAATDLRAQGVDTSSELCRRLLDATGVALLPAVAFGCPDSWLGARAAFVDFDGARALEASAEIDASEALGEDFLRAYCGPVVEAADRVVDWLPGRAKPDDAAEPRRAA